MNLLQRAGRGLEAGVLAGGAVAVLFFATDVLQFAPLRTVLELARPLSGVADPPSASTLASMAASASAVVLYTLAHFAAFAALGIAATWFVPAASFWATLVRGAAFGAVACSGVFVVGRMVAGSTALLPSLGPLTLLLTDAMAGVVMAAVFAVHASEPKQAGG